MTSLTINSNETTNKKQQQLNDITTNPIRDLETIDKLIEIAKLDKNDLNYLTQSIYLDNDLVNDDFKLLEIDDKNMQYLLEGNSLIIRGNQTDNAYCCSQSKTYSFKVAEISNPLLIATDIQYPDNTDNDDKDNKCREFKKSNVIFMTNTYFEMKIEKPKLEKLKYLLELNLYCGVSNEITNENSKKYTINDLFDEIQSSEDEIYNYLNYIEAFYIDGYWRLLDFNYLTTLIEHILKLIDERSWPLNEIQIDDLYQELKSLYPLSILNQITKYYFKKNSNNSLYELKKDKICRLFADILLRNTLKMRLSEFEQFWKQCVPTFDVDFKMLEGLAYIEDQYIYYLNSIDLPDDVEKRFKFLFEKRKKWPIDDIRVYISDICCDNTEINSLLAKYCRSFTQNGIKYFSSRLL